MAKCIKSIPGPRAIPLLGTVWTYSAFLGGRYSFERMNVAKRENYIKYGKIYREKIGPFTLVQLFDPEDFAKVFRAEGKCPNRPAIPITVVANKRDGFALGMGSLNGEDWRHYRMAVQRILMHPKAAFTYLPSENKVADDFIKYLRQKRNPSNTVDDILTTLLNFTIESNGVICFNERIGCLASDIAHNSEAYVIANSTRYVFQAVQKTAFAFPVYAFLRTPAYKQYVNHYRQLSKVTENYIKRAWDKTQKQEPSNMEENPNLLQSLIAVEKLDVEKINGILLDLFRAGLDSVAGSLSFLLYNLARNSTKQERLYQEIQRTTGGNSVPINEEHLASMSYLKACVKESFRLNFPVEGGTTRILDADLVLSNYLVPKGTVVAMNNQTILLESEHFKEPNEFLPERWLKNNDSKRAPKFAMLPFGYGPRMCIGRRFAEMEIYLAIIKILQNFHMEYEGERIEMLNRVFTIPDRPVMIKFLDR